MSRNWRSPAQAQAVLDQARRRGMVAEAAPVAAAAPAAATVAPKRAGKRRKQMNRTEGEYAAILDRKKRDGEILRYEFEGLGFRWAGTEEEPPMLFSPDFCVFDSRGLILVEVKGKQIWSRDIVRFKGCRAAWPEFRWQMWQKIDGRWTQLH